MKPSNLLLLFLPLLWPLSGCDDSGVTPAAGSAAKTLSGTFVLESFSVSCVVTSAPGSGTFQARLPFSLKYHFEGAPGTLNLIAMDVVGDLGTTLNLDYVAPDPVNRSSVFTEEFDGTSALAQKDSVQIRCTLAGAFWQVDGPGAVFQGAFEQLVEKKIPIVRP